MGLSLSKLAPTAFGKPWPVRRRRGRIGTPGSVRWGVRSAIPVVDRG
jgi:hypothetical protein